MEEESKKVTVDGLISILKNTSNLGKGEYTVMCNREYHITIEANRSLTINDEEKIVDLDGEYDP